MGKLTKPQIAAHKKACELLAKDRLTFDERFEVLNGWSESANHINSAAGAFFTPEGLASDFQIYVNGKRILDLCAGIGRLSLHAWAWRGDAEITCVEVNPDYAAIGRKVLPEARWIVADIFDLPKDLGRFDCVIGNPPFGATKRSGNAPRYKGKAFEYHLIDIASDYAPYGAFIVPQMSAPWFYSGTAPARPNDAHGLRTFTESTGIELEISSIDTTMYRDQWRGVAPAVEIVTADFPQRVDAQSAFQFSEAA